MALGIMDTNQYKVSHEYTEAFIQCKLNTTITVTTWLVYALIIMDVVTEITKWI